MSSMDEVEAGAAAHVTKNCDKVIVLEIPSDILLSILRSWLTLRDVVRLDSALLNHLHRSMWLNTLQNTTICLATVNVRDRDLPKLNWLSRRQAYCTKVAFRQCKLREPAFVPEIKQHWKSLGKFLKCLRFKERCSVASGLMMDLVTACPKLEELCVATRTVPSFSGNCLRQVVDQGQQLKTLVLTDSTDISAEDWTYLATHCTNLLELNLENIAFSPFAIPVMLDNMPNLGKLMLTQCSVAETMQSKTVKTLFSDRGTTASLTITEVLSDDAQREMLLNFKNLIDHLPVSPLHQTLYSIDLTHSKELADLLLPYFIRRCPRVERVNVSFCNLDQVVFRLMGQYWRRLRTLFMPGCSIHDKTFELLVSHCKNIETFVLGFSPFLTSIICDVMATCLHSLKTFALWGNHCAFTKDSMTTFVKGCPNIEKIALTRTNIDDIMLSILVENCPISRIEINGCHLVVGSAWVSTLCQRCGHLLTHFVAEEVPLDNTGILELAKCPNLEYVNLSHCLFLTNECLTELLTACPKISVLRLKQCPWVNDGTLALIGEHGHSVHELDISSNREISSLGILKMIEKVRSLRRLVALDCLKLMLSPESILDRIASIMAKQHITFDK